MKVYFEKGHKGFKPIKEKLCDLCKKSYLPNSFVQLYCSSCRLIKIKSYKKKWEIIHQKVFTKRRRLRDRTETAKARYARYRNTDKYREYSRNRYHSMEENKKRARTAQRNAVRNGKLIRPNNCEKCGIKDWGIGRSMIEAHHYLGYEKDHWFDIQWLCTNCHKFTDRGDDVE